MDRNFYDNDDFDEFLKQKADQYKMYPSDRVWNNIYSSLHGRKKWLIFGFTFLFMCSALFIGRQSVLTNYNRMATQLNKNPEILFSANIPGKTSTDNADRRLAVAPASNPAAATKVLAIAGNNNSTQNNLIGIIVPVTISGKTTAHTAGESAVASGEQHVLIENDGTPAMIASLTNNEKASVNLPVVAEPKSVTSGSAVLKPLPVKGSDPLPAAQNIATTVKSTKPSNWSVQLYASPTTSYRRLSLHDQAGYSSAPSSYTGSVERYVRHKPALGFEIGGRMQYKLSSSLSLYAGAQLNYARYYIDAYKYKVEKASIALNNARLSDTLSGYTDIRNFSGYAPEQLQNQYWQLSVPVGIEIKLLGTKKLQFGVAGGLQPTFLLHSNSYLISSDYKNYIQSPDLARSFNVHTNFEAFISYQAKGIRWQLGPQFRSQLLSSYSNQYRVREYLTEVGIKFGITKSLR